MMNLVDLVNFLIQNNSRVANNPNAREYLSVIFSGDSKRGEEIAQNLCNSFSVTREQAVTQAKNYFRL